MIVISDDSFDIFSENQQSNNELDLEGLQKLKNQYRSNSLIGYLNINFLQHKIDSLREILKKPPLEMICVDETKLDESFPDHQFKIDGYHFPPFRRDRDKYGGVKEGLIVNRTKEFKTNKSETICLELTISNKKWIIMYAYTPPNETNKKVFFDELNETLLKAVNKYDNIFLAGDWNIDTGDKSKDSNNYLFDFMDTFSLNNPIKVKTCYKSENSISNSSSVVCNCNCNPNFTDLVKNIT